MEKHITLRELFRATDFRGYISLYLVEAGVEYQTFEGHTQLSEWDCDGNLPERFLPYADAEVVKVFPSTDWRSFSPDGRDCKEVPSVHIHALWTPSDDFCELIYTGGNIWCGTCKLEDGWFFGETNSWGGIWKTYSQAIECFPDDDCGYIRPVETKEELTEIWKHIYSTIISNGGEEKALCEVLLSTLDEDLTAELSE